MTFEETIVWRTDEPPDDKRDYLVKCDAVWVAYRSNGEWLNVVANVLENVLAWAEMPKGPEL
jgi:hypothetical protein